MRKYSYIFLFIFVTSLLLSCKGKQAQTESNEDNTVTEITDRISDEPLPDNESNNPKNVQLKAISPSLIDVEAFKGDLISQSAAFSRIQQRLINDLLELDSSSVKALGEAKDVLKKYFKNVTAKQSDSLYVAYLTYASLFKSYVVNDEYYSQVAADYFGSYESFEDLPLAYQPIMKELNSYGIQLEDIGEGCADLSFYPDYYYEIFKPYTTEATREYLRLMAFERANEFLFDAAVCITWEELADRIVNFEKYLDKYPHSMFANDIKDSYNRYTSLLLTGCDNTPTRDSQQNGLLKLNADVYEAYQRIASTYQHRRLAKIVKEYCSLFEENNMLWNDELDDFLAKDDFATRY